MWAELSGLISKQNLDHCLSEFLIRSMIIPTSQEKQTTRRMDRCLTMASEAVQKKYRRPPQTVHGMFTARAKTAAPPNLFSTEGSVSVKRPKVC